MRILPAIAFVLGSTAAFAQGPEQPIGTQGEATVSEPFDPSPPPPALDAPASNEEPQAADETEFSPEFASCLDASSGVTSSMLDCIDAEIVVQDASLNETWGRISAVLSPAEMDPLRTAQRAWIAFRDARCTSEAALSGDGSLSSVVYADCILLMTVERTRDLVRTASAE